MHQLTDFQAAFLMRAGNAKIKRVWIPVYFAAQPTGLSATITWLMLLVTIVVD